MANKPPPYSLTFQGDFSEIVREAKKASMDLQDIFKKAAEKGFKNANLRSIATKVEANIREEYKLRKQMELRIERQRSQAEGRFERDRLDTLKKVESLEQKILDEKDEAKKEDLKAALKLAKLRRAIFNENAADFNEETKKVTRNLQKVVKELVSSEKAAKRSAGYYDRTAERIGRITKLFSDDMDAGADHFIDKLSAGLDGLAGKLTSSVDLGSLVKGGSGAASSGLRAIGDALGNLGKVGPVLATTMTTLAGVVGVFGVLAGVMFDMDRKVKEFNKSAIDTHGALALNRLGAGNLTQGLRILNHTVTDLTGNMGVSQETANTLFDVLDKGGFTLDRLAGRTSNADLAQANLSRGLVSLATTAKMSGVSLTEYAQNVTDYVNDLGMSLDGVNDSFANIADMAAKASFGTRRFYSMVVQATSGQSSLNVRLDQTAGLLLRMTKILGAKKATEMITSASTDLANMGGQERTKMALLSGGRGTRIAGREAQSQATNFAVSARKSQGALSDALRQAGVGANVGEAIRAAGVAGAGDDANETARTSATMVAALREMSNQQQSALIAALQANPATVEMGRQMSQLIDLTKASSGLGGMVNGMQAIGAGGSIAMRLSQLSSVGLGRLEDINSAEGRMAAENVTGLSGAQYDMMREVSRVVSGQFAILQKNRPLTDIERRKQIEQYGATTDSSGVMRAASLGSDGSIHYLERIEQANDLISGYMSRSDLSLGAIKTEQSALMNSTFEATVSVADILENKILFYMRALYENFGVPLLGYVSDLLDKMGIGNGGARNAAAFARGEITRKMQEDAVNQSINQRSLSRLNATLDSTADPNERKRMLAEKKVLEQKIAERATRTEGLRAAQARINSGNTWDLRAGRGRDELDQLLGRFGVADPNLNVSLAHLNQPGAAAPAIPSPALATPATPGLSAPAVTVAPSSTDTNAAQTQAVTQAVNQASTVATDVATSNAAEARKNAEQRHQQSQQHLTRLLTRETKLGDALARSKLPDAIVEAQVRQELMALGTASGLSAEDSAAAAAKFIDEGVLSDTLKSALKSALTSHPELSAAAMHAGIGSLDLNTRASRYRVPRATDGVTTEDPVEDFIYRGNGVRGSITPIANDDQFFGARPGGAIDQAVNGRGGTVINNIYGDERRTYDIVKRVLREAGITGNRVSHA